MSDTRVEMKKVPFDPQTFLDHYAGHFMGQLNTRWGEPYYSLGQLSDHYKWLKPEWQVQVGPKLNQWLRSHDKETRFIAIEFADALALPETLWTLRWVGLKALLLPWRWGSVQDIYWAIKSVKEGRA